VGSFFCGGAGEKEGRKKAGHSRFSKGKACQRATFFVFWEGGGRGILIPILSATKAQLGKGLAEKSLTNAGGRQVGAGREGDHPHRKSPKGEKEPFPPTVALLG